MGIAAGDFDNDGAPDVLAHRGRRQPAVPQLGGGTFADVTAKAGLGGRRAFSTSAMWFDYDKDGRLDLLICNYVQWTPQRRRLLQRRRQGEELLHAGGLSRQHVVALSQQGRRHLRGRHRQGRLLRRDVEVARRDAARPRPGRLARRLRRQRHPAEQALSQQRQRHVHRAGAEGRRGVQRGRPGPRRDGRRRGRSRRLRPPDRRRDQLLRRDARPVPRRSRTASTSIARPARTSAARRGRRSAGAASSSTSISTAGRICSSSTGASTPRASRPARPPASDRHAAPVPQRRRPLHGHRARRRRDVRHAEDGPRRRLRRHRRATATSTP